MNATAGINAYNSVSLESRVMGADPHDVAIGIYRQVGFREHDTLWLLERRAPADRAAAA